MLTKIGLMQPTRKKLQLSSLPLYFILNYSLKDILYTDNYLCKYTILIDGMKKYSMIGYEIYFRCQPNAENAYLRILNAYYLMSKEEYF